MKLLMLLFLFITISAQRISKGQLDWTITLESQDHKQKIMLHSQKGCAENVEGYFTREFFTNLLDGALDKGVYTFFEDEQFGLPIYWVINKFPVRDIETLSNGFVTDYVINFRIVPVVTENEPDTLGLLFNYIISENTDSDRDRYHEMNLRTRRFHKLLHIPYNEPVKLDFFSDDLNNYNLLFEVKKLPDGPILTDTGIIPTEVKKAVSDSGITVNDILFNINLIKSPEIKPMIHHFYFGTIVDDLLLLLQQKNIEKRLFLNSNGSPHSDKDKSFYYYQRFIFPFTLYNKVKERQYSAYKTRAALFQSEYEVFILPVERRHEKIKKQMLDEVEKITVDVYIYYNKLAINQVPRWTPLKKRLTLVNSIPVMIELPKENWSAHFSRQGEKYNIYGYSDYERYVHEYIFVSFDYLNRARAQ
jgi:hypothetical protein